MDVTLPNGKVITGIPEGVGKHAIAMKAIRNGLATNADFGYEEVKTDSSALEAVGAGMANVGRRAANLVLPKSLTPEWASDEAIAEQSDLDQDLEEDNGGWKMVGEIAATLPAGGVGSGVAKGAAGLAARAGSRPVSALARTLGRGVGRGAVEGATVGAVMADPGDRMAGAAGGAAFGGALGAAGTALGKVLGKGKLVNITKEAEELQNITGHFIPLSQSAEDGMVKMIYNAGLANIPGVGGKLRGQYKTALDDVRRFAAEKALPDTPHAHNIVNLTGKESIDELVPKLKNYWDTAFDEIDNWTFKAFKDTTTPPNWLVKALKNHVKSGLKIPVPGTTISGAQLRSLNTALGEVRRGLAGKDKIVLDNYKKSLHDLMKKNLDPTGKGRGQAPQVLRRYEEAADKYGTWQTFLKASETAKNNADFSMASLAKKGKPDSVVRRAGELGVRALEDFPSRQGLFQTLAATSPVLAGVGAMAGGASLGATATGLVGAILGGRILVSKGLQKYLSGQTKTQALNKALMKKWSKELQLAGMTARDAAIVLGAQDAS